MTSSPNFEKIRAIVLDIDGVLTDGRIGYGGGSGDEIKFFFARDGQRLKLASRAGLLVGVLSGRDAAANRTRAEELHFDFIYQGCKDKLSGFETLLREQGLKAEECLYIGDDIVDMPPMRRAGIAVVTADGWSELDEVADYRTSRKGGQGAVCETVEWLLKGKNLWREITAIYYA